MNKTKGIIISLAFIIAALPLSACGQNSSKTVAARVSGNASGKNSSQTEIVGKVTSIVGNKVELALGSLKSGSGEKSGSKADIKSGDDTVSDSGNSSASVSSAASSQTSSEESTNSSLITLTGETKTVLIPVGLTLSQGSENKSNQKSGSSTSGQEQPQQGGNDKSGSNDKSGEQMPQGNSNSMSGGMNQQNKSDFSSITKGMILRITEEKASDGTENVVKVTILSE